MSAAHSDPILDPTGIVSGNVQQLAAHLYSLLSGYTPGTIPDSAIGFLMQYNNYCLNKTKEVALELTQAKYPNGKLVVYCLMSYIVNKFGYASGGNIHHLEPFIYTWLGQCPNLLLDYSLALNQLIFCESSVEDFKQLAVTICNHKNRYKGVFLHRYAACIKEVCNFGYMCQHPAMMLDKVMFLVDLDTESEHASFWKSIESIIKFVGVYHCVDQDEYQDEHQDEDEDDETNWSLEGYVFAKAKQLRQIKAKYIQRDPFEELLGHADAIHEVIEESNTFHPGVDRIIMSYL